MFPAYWHEWPKDVLYTVSIPFQRNGSLLPVPDCVLVQIRVFPAHGLERPLCQFPFKEMGPYCLFLTAFWSKLGFFQPMGFEGQRMCFILCQFLFKEMGPYCLFLTAFWSKLGFFQPMGFDVSYTVSIPFQRNGSLLPVPDCVLVQIKVFPAYGLWRPNHVRYNGLFPVGVSGLLAWMARGCVIYYVNSLSKKWVLIACSWLRFGPN